MYGHERSLVRRYQGQPFALLGVNADESPDTLRHVLRDKDLPWRAWWDGPSGPISRLWGVDGFPTLILLDHKGVVRYRFEGNPGAERLDAAVAELMREVPQAS